MLSLKKQGTKWFTKSFKKQKEIDKQKVQKKGTNWYTKSSYSKSNISKHFINNIS